MVTITVALGCLDPTNDVTLAIDMDDTCTSDILDKVTELSIVVLGSGEGSFCIAGVRCVSRVALSDINSLTELLAEQVQPLIDVESSDFNQVEIVGHESHCLSDEDQLLWGRADVANTGPSSQLQVTLGCNPYPEIDPMPVCPP